MSEWRDVVTSTNGTDWVQRPPSSESLYGIAYGNGKFVALGSWRSSPRPMVLTGSQPAAIRPHSIAFGNGQFVARRVRQDLDFDRRGHLDTAPIGELRL